MTISVLACSNLPPPPGQRTRVRGETEFLTDNHGQLMKSYFGAMAFRFRIIEMLASKGQSTSMPCPIIVAYPVAE
jgi:hypothetical protein